MERAIRACSPSASRESLPVRCLAPNTRCGQRSECWCCSRPISGMGRFRFVARRPALRLPLTRYQNARTPQPVGSTLAGHLVIHRIGVEGDRDTRLVALVGLDVVLHPAGEEHEQTVARTQVDVSVPVGYASLDVTVNYARTW